MAMDSFGYQAAAYARDAADVRGLGWLTFATGVLSLTGALNVVVGIVVVSRSRLVPPEFGNVLANLGIWGWVVMVLGAVEVLMVVAILGVSIYLLGRRERNTLRT
jgi:hypothetical protein